MIKIKKTNLLLLLLLSFQMGFSQPWMNKVTSEKPTFQEIQTAFNEYWKDRAIEKGKGYKPFKRWEWYWESRLLPNGEFPSPSITWDEFHKYYSQRNQNAQRSAQSMANWTFSGPSSSNGGYSGLGRINCMAFHPTDPNTFWVGTPAGGLWKTNNGGTNWTTNTDNLPVLGVSDIAVHPNNPNILYIATGDGDFGSLSSLTGGALGDTKSVGILKSTDGGATWNTTGLNWSVTAAKLIRRLLINPINPQILIAAASDGIWRTTDGGATWFNTQSGYFMDLEYKPGDPTIVYASSFELGNAKIYRSTDSGGTWNLISTLANVTRINLAVTPNAPNLVDALCAYYNPSGSGLSGLWFSSNSGASFSQYFTSNDTNNLLHSSYNASGAGGQGYYDLAYAINPNNYNDIWLGGVNTWNSTNGGSNWNIKTMWNPSTSDNPNNVPVVHADKHFIAFHPLVPGTMFECNDGGLYKTINGGSSWTDLTNGMQISQMYRIGVSQSLSNPKILCGLQDNGTKLNNLPNWEDVFGGDGMECIYDGSTDTGYMSSQYGTFYRSGSPGINISSTIPFLPTEVTPPVPPSTVSTPKGAWVTPLIMHPTNTSTLYAGYKRVYKTTNRGDTWTPISAGVLDSNSEDIRFMAIAPSNPNTIYAATLKKLYSTTNGGTSWNLILDSGTIQNFANLSGLAVDPTNPDKVFVTVSGYTAGDKVYMKPGIGQNWINYSGSLPNVPVNCIVYQNGSNEGLYIGTDIGVFYTDGSMNDWIPYQTGLPNVVVTDLEISYYDNKLWAGTFGRGLWKTNLYTNLSINDEDLFNQIIVSPNPNDGLFTVNVPLGKSYSLIVYDVLGKKVYEKEVINTEQKRIDLTKENSGIYLLQITIDGKLFSKKIIKN